MSEEKWFIEKSDLNPGYGVALTKDEKLFYGKSDFQIVEVFNNKLFGNVMLIDNMVMVTDKDEFVYHDCLVHVPMCVKPDAKKILVIGGGDGGTVRELCKYPVEKIVMVEIDKLVVDVARRYFPDLASKLDDSRVELIFEDGVKFVKECKDVYDLILIDSTDPVSVGEGLFTPEFYKDCFRILGEDGVLVNQSESGYVNADLVKATKDKLTKIFPVYKPYYGIIPTYPGILWMFGFASKKLDPIVDMKKVEWEKFGLKTKYYNTDIHKAAFVLPNFMRELLG